MTKLNFGLIGCGRIGNRHAEHISNVGNLKAVCDIDRIKAEGLGSRYNANVYTAIDEL